MTFSEIIGALAIVMIFSTWMIPLIYLLVNGKIAKKQYRIVFWIGIILIVLLFVLLVVFVYYELNENVMNIVISANFAAIVCFNYYFHNQVEELFENKKDMTLRLHRLFSVVMVVVLILTILEALQGFIKIGPDMSITTLLAFTKNNIIALVMLLRIVGTAYVVLITYVYMIYALAKDKYIKDGISDITAANSYIRKYTHWKKILLVSLIGVMISFLLLAEMNISNLGDGYQEKFIATREVYHLIATAIFIPLFFDLLRNSKDGGE